MSPVYRSTVHLPAKPHAHPFHRSFRDMPQANRAAANVAVGSGTGSSGYAVEVLIPAWDCPQQAGQVEQMDGLTLRYPELGPAPHHLLDLALMRRMLAAADAFQPDIVHAFKPIGYSGVLASLLKRRGYPVMVDIDDLETAAGWGQKRRWGLRQVVEVQEQRVLRMTDGVSAASTFLQGYATSILNCRTSSLLYLPNGLDLAPEPAPVITNPPIVLLYTRGNDLTPERVHKLWSAIVQKVPQASLRIVGDWAAAPPLPQCEHLGWLEGEVLVDCPAKRRSRPVSCRKQRPGAGQKPWSFTGLSGAGFAHRHRRCRRVWIAGRFQNHTVYRRRCRNGGYDR